MKKLFTLLTLLLCAVSVVWAGDVYKISFNGSNAETKNGEGVTAGTYFSWNSAKHNFNTKFSGCTYDGVEYTSGLKMEGATTVSWTSASSATVTIVQSTWSDNTIKLDGTELAVADAEAITGGRVYTITDVEAGSHSVTRGSGESGIFTIIVEYTGAVLTQLDSPEISFNATSGEVTIGAVTNATKVTYTTDGTNPTAESTTYESPFIVEDGTVVKAIAIGSGSYSNSDVATETVYLTGITCATPVIKKFNGSVAITTTTPNATIKYSLNDGAYNTYTRSFTLPSGATVKAYAERTGCKNSSEASLAVSVLATNKTKTIYLDFDDFTIDGYTATGKADTDAEDYMLTIGNTSKSWSSNGVNITTPGGEKKEFKLSNGAQNTLSIPDGVHVTKLTLYSVIMNASNTTPNGWKEVGGENYQTGDNDYKNVPMGAYNDVDDYNTNPDVRSYDIDQTGGTITFTNAGNQLSFVIALDILGDNTTITPANDKSTYVTTSDLDFSGVAGLKAYVATAAAGGKVTLEEVGAVPANTPLMLIGTASTEYIVPLAASASAPAVNMFVAGDGTTTFDGTTYDYILFSDGLFYQIGSGAVPVGKAYLHCTSDPTTASAPYLSIDFGGTTGINAVKDSEKVNGEYYNLAGQRVAQPTKGLYIVNGKKVIIK